MPPRDFMLQIARYLPELLNLLNNMAMHVLDVINPLLLLITPQHRIVLSQVVCNLVLEYLVLLKCGVLLVLDKVLCVRLESVAPVRKLLVYSFLSGH